MPSAPKVSASPIKVFDLFDPEEKKAFLTEKGIAHDDMLERFTASDMLVWIVRYRSTFVQMAIEISTLLTKIEASIRGNIEFILTYNDGKEVEFAFGPQIRTVLHRTATWNKNVAADLHEQLAATLRKVSNFCREAKTTEVERDSSISSLMREASSQHLDPFNKMKFEYAANFFRSHKTEIHPLDVALLLRVREAAMNIENRAETLLDKNPNADAIRTKLREVRKEADQAYRRVAAYRSPELQPPRPRLAESRANHIIKDLDEIEGLIRRANRLDETEEEVLEAMALSMWKERWRLYELWVFCFICLWLVKRSDKMDLSGRIQDGRWTLKFTRDTEPVFACGASGQWIDVFYQYFEQGQDRANMPDVGVRNREAKTWIAIVDPKMGETYKTRDKVLVCLRYAKFFQAGASIIASYFPDEASIDQLTDTAGAVICNGLRPGSSVMLSNALSFACKANGISLAIKRVVILADVSSSMTGSHSQMMDAIRHMASCDLSINHEESIVASFNDQWVEQVSVEKFLITPSLSPAGGATDRDGAIRKAVELLSGASGVKEIWLFSDGESLTVGATESAQRGIRLSVHVLSGGTFELVE